MNRKKLTLTTYVVLASILSLTFLSFIIFGVYKDASPIEATQKKMMIASAFASSIMGIVGLMAFKWLRSIK